MVTGRLHAQNIYDSGITGSYADSFYRYLNVGIKMPFSTGTDWFIFDYGRVYAAIDGDRTTESWCRPCGAGKASSQTVLFWRSKLMDADQELRSGSTSPKPYVSVAEVSDASTSAALKSSKTAL